MSGVIVIPGGTTPSGVALEQYRRATTKRIGRGVVYQTTAAATGAERRRHVVVSRLADDEIPLEGLAGLHLYVFDGDEAGHQTRVMSTGTHGPLGLLEMAKRTSTAIASGTTIELSGSLPAVSYLDWPAMNDCVNKALDSLPVHVDVPFEYVTQQVRYDLSDTIWPTFRREDVLDVYPPISSGMTAAQTVARPISRGNWSVEYDGESPWLQLHGWGANDGETFYVRMRRPASTWINNGGWAASTSGLTADGQEALYDVDRVVAVAAPIACDRLESYWLDRGDEAQAMRWAHKRQEIAGAAVLARIKGAFRSDGRQKVGARGRGGRY